MSGPDAADKMKRVEQFVKHSDGYALLGNIRLNTGKEKRVTGVYYNIFSKIYTSLERGDGKNGKIDINWKVF